MELGALLKQARLEAGLSQRQLCSGEITRNMLSLIENGAARPSMATLQHLAARLGKPVSYFLDETAVTSPNQALMAQARAAETPHEALEVLEGYHAPDPVFDPERELLTIRALLEAAEAAIAQGRGVYAGELLEKAGAMGETAAYYPLETERRRLLLLAKAQPQLRPEICGRLPSLDEELLLRARAALDEGDHDRCAALLEAAEDRDSPEWNFLRGEAYLNQGQFGPAAACYHRAEATWPEKTVPRLERCYRELEDFKQAYFYACKQR